MKADGLRDAGAPGKAPLPGRSSLSLSTSAPVRNACLAMHNPLRFSSQDFQTCHIADSPRSVGREVALDAGLEICAVAVRQRNSVYNLRLSSVAACHR
jgi:hypothetical protein